MQVGVALSSKRSQTVNAGEDVEERAQTVNVGEDVEKREPSYTVGGNAIWPLWRTVWCFLKKT